jgi:hypothetical protein
MPKVRTKWTRVRDGSIIEDESTSCEEIEKEADRLAPEEAL